MRPVFSILISVFLALSAVMAKGEDSATLPDVTYLAVRIEAARLQLGHAQATVVEERHIPTELVPFFHLPSQPFFHQDDRWVARWYSDGPRLAMYVKHDLPNRGADLLQTRLVIADGVGRWYDEMDRNFRGGIEPAGDMLKSGVWPRREDLDPRYLAYYDWKPLDEALRNPAYAARVLGKETVYGSPCVKVEVHWGTDRDDIWIDTEHGFVIRKIRGFDTIGGVECRIQETDAPEMVQSGARWLPAKVVRRMYVNPGTGDDKTPPDPKKFLPITTTCTISGFEMNPEIDPVLFELNWPIGTFVQDDVHKRIFTVVAQPLSPEGQPGGGAGMPGKDTPGGSEPLGPPDAVHPLAPAGAGGKPPTASPAPPPAPGPPGKPGGR